MQGNGPTAAVPARVLVGRGVAPVPNPNSKNQRRKARKAARMFSRPEADVAVTLGRLRIADSPPVQTFDDMHLKPDLLRGIHSRGLERPAFCQQNVVMPMIAGRDVICQAQSGMGKTAAFVISILQRLDLDDPMCKALVLAPTRELAEQILEEFRTFGQYMKVRCIPCIGGVTRMRDNLANVRNGNFHVAVGTLGRIAHLLHPRVMAGKDDGPGLNGDTVKMFVIDEADKMVMDRSFAQDLGYIFRTISPNAQMIVTSATMPSPAFDQCKGVMRNPFTFLLRNDQLTLDGIREFHVKVGNDAGKLTTLDELFPFLKEARGIVFCKTRSRAEQLAQKMQARNHNVEGMTGTMEQDVRNGRLQDFKSGRVPVLIASDLLGRGVDIHHVQLVINYDLPDKKEEYIHRIGRAGRYGKKGVALTFVTDAEVSLGKVKELEEFYETQIPELRAAVGDLMNNLN